MPALFQTLSTKQKLTLGGAVAASLIAIVLLFKMATAPSYTEVMAGVDPAQTGKITSALDSRGVSYELRSNGTAIAVKDADVGTARIALAEAGVSSTAKQPGYELLDKQKLGASNFQQQVAYQRALEGQISNTLTAIDGVDSAQVSLTLPKDQLFADESQPATASVLLSGDPSALDGAAVRGMANLVAGAVQGLKTDHVTITDSTGQMLWPQGDGAGGSASTNKVTAQSRYDSQLTSQLNSMLASTLGPNKAQVQVHSDLNVDQSNVEKLAYAKKGTPLTSKTSTETLKGTGGATGGATGTTSNIPSYAQTTGASGNSNYKKTDGETTFGVDKTITKTTIAPGTVNRLSVALLVDKSVPAATVAQLKTAIANAAGLQTPRDPAVSATTVTFPKAATAPSHGPVPTGMLPYIKGGAIGLAALVFLFFLARHLRKREDEPFANEPAWLQNLSSPYQLPPAGYDDPTMRFDDYDPQAAARSVFENDPRAIALEDLVDREPERVAQQLRTWITEDR